MTSEKKEKDDVIFINQRQNRRVSVELEVSVSGPHNFFNGLTQDISRGGVFVATHQVYPIGTEFNIELHIEGKEIKVLSKVVWIRENTPFLPEGIEPGMGLQFTDLSDDDLSIIEGFIRKKEPIFFDVD